MNSPLIAMKWLRIPSDNMSRKGNRCEYDGESAAPSAFGFMPGSRIPFLELEVLSAMIRCER